MEINTRMKKYHHYLTLLSLFMLLGILKLQAAIQLPAIFSNHMVLQRNSELTFWGWGIPGETISIAPEWMKGEIIKTQVNNTGKWSARVPSGEAGGPYEIRFSGSSEVTLTDVMLGRSLAVQRTIQYGMERQPRHKERRRGNGKCPLSQSPNFSRGQNSRPVPSRKLFIAMDTVHARNDAQHECPGLLLRPQHPGRAGRAGRNHRSRMGRNHRRDMDAPRMRNERPGLVRLSV